MQEKPPTGKKKTKEFAGQQFDVERPSTLSATDVLLGDRTFIMTESGNRYMLRRSTSDPKVIKIYNERADGFKQGLALYGEGEIARVGNNFHFTVRISRDKGQEYDATKVIGIEIRRGIDAAIQKAAAEKGSALGEVLTETITSKFKGTATPSSGDEDAKTFEKFRKK